MEKKGLSPVIATLILISIAIILAVIIFLWARGFVTDQTLKLDKPIADVCQDVKFSAEAKVNGASLDVSVVNQAAVPLYGIEVRKKKLTSMEPLNAGAKQFDSGSLAEGSDAQVSISLDNSGSTSEVAAGDEVLIVPMIVGLSGDIMKSYTCDSGESVTVG